MKSGDRPLFPVLLAGLAVAGVFIADLLMFLGFAAWCCYLLILVSASHWLRRAWLCVLAAACTAFILAGIHLAPHAHRSWASVSDDLLGCCIVWFATYVVLARRQANESLRESEGRFQRIVDHSPISMAIVGMDGTIEYINKKAIETFGYPHADIPNMDRWWVQAYPDEAYRKHVISAWTSRVEAALAAKEEIQGGEYRVTCRDGTVKTIYIFGVPVSNKIFVIFDDITERKRTEESLRESEEHYRFLFDNMLNGFAYCRMIFNQGRPEDFIYLDVNQSFETLTGLRNVAGKRVSEIIPGIRESDPELFELYGRVALSGKPERVETHLTAMDMWFSLSVYSPRREHFVVFFDVITERKRAEEALRDSESRSKAMLQAIPDMMFRIDSQGVFLDYKADIDDLYAQAEPSLVGKRNRDLTPPDFADLIDERIRAALTTGAVQTFEYQLPIPGRGMREYEARMAVSGLDEVTAIVRDITERKQGEVGVTRLAAIVDNSSDFVAMANLQGEVVYINPSALSMLGYDPTEREAVSIERAHPPEDAERVKRIGFPEAMQKGSWRSENRLCHRNGHLIPVEQILFPVRDKEMRIYAIGTIMRDISDRKRAEAALRESERIHRVMADNSVDMISRHAIDGTVLFVTPSCERLTGYRVDELLGKQADFLVLADDWQRIWEIVRSRQEKHEHYQVEHRLPRKDGTIIWVETIGRFVRDESGRVTEIQCNVRDITERKRVEEELARHRDHLEEMVEERTRERDQSREQLRRSERLASLGTLAAGIAHEINNPIGMIMLDADLALSALDRPEALRPLIERQKKNVARCSHIVKGMLDFAREKPATKRVLDLNEIVRHGLDFTQEYARTRGVAVDVHLADRVGPVLGSTTELEQVVVNLVYNAVQACSKDGRVTIETHAADGTAYLEVRDNGCGMSPEQVEHIFDPFFTTRLEKGGTGLGLSIVHGIVTSHGGTIAVDSEQHRGTVFRIAFPHHNRGELADGEDTGR